MRKVLARLVAEMRKLGATIVAADMTSIILATGKRNLTAAVGWVLESSQLHLQFDLELRFILASKKVTALPRTRTLQQEAIGAAAWMGLSRSTSTCCILIILVLCLLDHSARNVHNLYFFNAILFTGM